MDSFTGVNTIRNISTGDLRAKELRIQMGFQTTDFLARTDMAFCEVIVTSVEECAVAVERIYALARYEQIHMKDPEWGVRQYWDQTVLTCLFKVELIPSVPTPAYGQRWRITSAHHKDEVFVESVVELKTMGTHVIYVYVGHPGAVNIQHIEDFLKNKTFVS